MISLKCKYCNAEYERYPSQVTAYCSRVCNWKAQVGRPVIHTKKRCDAGIERKEKVIKCCLYCSKEMRVIPALRHRKNYCSRICYTTHKKELVLGSDNPAWTGGQSRKKRSYRGDGWEVRRREIYARDKWTCTECGIKCISKRDANKETSHRIIQCHHNRKYRETQDNSDANLRTVCLRCHIKVDKRGQS